MYGSGTDIQIDLCQFHVKRLSAFSLLNVTDVVPPEGIEPPSHP